MSTIQRISGKEADQAIIAALAEAYYAHYRRKGVCFLPQEVLSFLKSVASHDGGFLLASFDDAGKIQALLVALPIVDYPSLTGMRNLFGSELLHDKDVLFVDTLIDLSDQAHEPNSLLLSLPYYLRTQKILKIIMAIVPAEDPLGYYKKFHASLINEAYQRKVGFIEKEEVVFTEGGRRKIRTRNLIFCKTI